MKNYFLVLLYLKTELEIAKILQHYILVFLASFIISFYYRRIASHVPPNDFILFFYFFPDRNSLVISILPVTHSLIYDFCLALALAKFSASVRKGSTAGSAIAALSASSSRAYLSVSFFSASLCSANIFVAQLKPSCTMIVLDSQYCQ